MAQEILNQLIQKGHDSIACGVSDHGMDSHEHTDARILTREEYLRDFWHRLHKWQDDCISTGFEKLDAQLSGGLREGLYVIGGMPSIGKTAFCLQMADQIVKAGHHVLYFSLLETETDMLFRSFSRLTFIKEHEKGRGSKNAKTVADFRNGDCFIAGTDASIKSVQEALEEYCANYKCMYIASPNERTTVSDVRNAVEAHIHQTGKVPVIFVDYMQFMSNDEPTNTDKQNTDAVVSGLKQMSIQFHTPIIAISTINRSSYSAPITYASFKGTGGVEYFADVLIGMQYEGMQENSTGESERARAARIAKLISRMDKRAGQGKDQAIQLTIIKNADGLKGNCPMAFYPAYNYFAEPPAESPSTDCTAPNGEWGHTSHRRKKASTSK